MPRIQLEDGGAGVGVASQGEVVEEERRVACRAG